MHYGLMNAIGTASLLIAVSGLIFLSNSTRDYENQLVKAKNEAERALQIKDEFLSLTSHEIQTPLNVVLGMANVLIQENPIDLNHKIKSLLT